MYHLLVKWQGCPESFNSFEPLHRLAEDVPVLVKKYIATIPDEAIRAVLTTAIKGPPKRTIAKQRKSIKKRRPTEPTVPLAQVPMPMASTVLTTAVSPAVRQSGRKRTPKIR